MSLQMLASGSRLPELAVAGDAAQMVEIFRRRLRPIGNVHYDIRACRLSRLRYHESDRCLLRYTLDLVDCKTGAQQTLWVTGLLRADDRALQIWRKLRVVDAGTEFLEAFAAFHPIEFIPELRMLVQVFPYDRRLPVSHLIARGRASLEATAVATLGPGDWRVERADIEPVRYRPERVAVLRCMIQASDAGTGRTERMALYAKVYRDEEGERAFEALRLLHDRAEDSGNGWTVGKPLVYLSQFNALLMEQAPGTSLQHLLLHGCDPIAAVRKAATALAAFHLERIAAPRRHPLREEMRTVVGAGKLIQHVCPQSSAEVDSILGSIATLVVDAPPRPTHRELKADHMFLDRHRLVLIDLDSFAGADPIVDPARLLAHLAGLRLRFDLPDDGGLRTAAQAFADEYFVHVPPAWRDRLAVHYAGAALKEATGFFRRQEGAWPEKVAALVGEASDSLAGRLW
jgi:hypothetical protein